MSGLDSMKQRMKFYGETKDDRIVKGKLDSFHSALWNSYQGEWITLDKGEETERKCRCLINPSRLTEEMDKKIISIDFDSGIEEGTIFYWDRTERYWIVNLQQHTEEAYFRGDIKRCEHQVEINDHLYWVYLRGPLETDFEWLQKHNLYYNKLNYSIRIDIKKNKETMDYFSRFNFIKIFNKYKDDNGLEYIEEHKWQVAATDKYSSSSIIEVYLDEYNDNSMEDAMIKNEEVIPNKLLPYISGPQFINVFDTNIVYKIENASDGEFIIDSDKVKIISSNEESCTINVLTGKTAQFDIIYQYINNEFELEEVLLTVKIKSF